MTAQVYERDEQPAPPTSRGSASKQAPTGTNLWMRVAADT